MRNRYPIQILDLRHKVDHITSEKIQPFEELNTDPTIVNARVFVLLVRHRQIETISDGYKIIEINVF